MDFFNNVKSFHLPVACLISLMEYLSLNMISLVIV